MNRLLLILQMLFLPALAQQATAVTLGEEFILSRLGDPVEVEIDVLQWEDIDLAQVRISAAGRSEYDTFDLSWHPAIELLNFNLLGPDLDGEVKVLVSSREPFGEPFLELLLVLRWPGGSLLREYVLLFDPPGAPATMPQPVTLANALQTEEPEKSEPEQPAEPADDPVQPIPEPAVQLPAAAAEEAEPVFAPEMAQPQEPVSAGPLEVRTFTAIEVGTPAPPQPEPAPAVPPAAERRTYQVRPGDNLWDIARQFRPAGVGENLYQMLLSIHDLNRRAFINGNISLLRANATIELPVTDDITQIDPATAQAVFEQRWDEGTRRFEAAQRGEALPVFAGPAPVAEEPVVEAPELPLGQEAPGIAQPDLLIQVDDTNALQPLPDAEEQVPASDTDPGAQSPAVPPVSFPETPPVIVVVERNDPPPDTAQEAPPSPALDRINAAAASVQDLLASRQQRIRQVQQEILLVRERLDQTRLVTAALGSTSGGGQSSLQSGSLVLVVAVALLSLALLLALALVLREAARLRQASP